MIKIQLWKVHIKMKVWEKLIMRVSKKFSHISPHNAFRMLEYFRFSVF